MADNDNKTMMTKEEIRKEIRRENKKYRRKRGMATFAVLLVLVALILVFLFANKKGLLGDKGLDMASIAGKVNNAIENYDETKVVSKIDEYLSPNEEEDKKDDEDKKYLENNTIVVSDTVITFEGKKVKSVDELKDKLLERNYSYEDVITLKEDKAIMSVYLEVKNLLDEMENIQYIEE